MKIRVLPGENCTVLLPPDLGGMVVPQEGMEVEDSSLFIQRRLADGDLVLPAMPAPRAQKGE